MRLIFVYRYSYRTLISFPSISCFSGFAESILQKKFAYTLWLGRIIPFLNRTLSTFDSKIIFTYPTWISNNLGIMPFARWIWAKNSTNLTANQHFLPLYFQQYFIDTYHVSINYWCIIYCINEFHQYAALIIMEPGAWFNRKINISRCRNSHHTDKKVMRATYLYLISLLDCIFI